MSPALGLTGGPLCDFCAGPDPVWIYPAADFPLHLITAPTGSALEVSRGGWTACAPCGEHIELDSHDALAARAMTQVAKILTDLQVRSVTAEALATYVRANHDNFRDHRTGDRAGFG